MAKSLRSKWRRKCRAVKRERYGEKELARLKKTLGIDENSSQDTEMAEISEIATVVDAKQIKDASKAKQDNADVMEVDNPNKVYDSKTLRNKHGNYPVWMNRRKILKHKKGRAKSQKATNKTGKRLTRKEKKARKEK